MSTNPISKPNVDSQIESSNVIGTYGASRSGFWRAMMYMPVVLLTSAFVAVAMFPNLAEYATPLLDLNQPKAACISTESPTPECMQQMMQRRSTCPVELAAAADESAINADLIEQSDESPADATSVANSVGAESGSD